MFISKWIINRALGHPRPNKKQTRQRLGMLEGWISAVFSLVLSMVKAVLGWMSGSISLMADAVNNFADLGSSLVVAISFHLAQKPRDARHPYGHGRMECIAGLVLSILLIVVGIEVARAGIVRLFNPEPITAPPLIMTIVIITIVAKTWMALFARLLAKMCDSTVLWADAWNHTFDIACTALVLLALWGSRHGFPAIDGWAGIAVSFFIIYTGGKFGLKTISSLLGEAPTHEEVEQIKTLALSREGVMGTHDVMIHKYGDVHIISLHIEVDARQPVLAIHELSEEVESLIEQNLPDSKVIVHTDPIDRNYTDYEEIENLLHAHIASIGEILEFHDLRLEGESTAIDLSVDLVLKADVPSANYARIQHDLENKLRTNAKPLLQQIIIRLETSYEDQT